MKYKMLALTGLMFSHSVMATSMLAPLAPTVGDQQEFQNRLPFSGGTFDREKYESIGVVNKVIQDENNMLEAGEFWLTYLVQKSTGKRIYSYTMVYSSHVSPDDDNAVCVYFGLGEDVDLNSPYRQCALKDPGNGELQTVAFFGINWKLNCDIPDDYEIVVEHTLGTDSETFALNDYVPAKPIISDLPDITPEVPSSYNKVSKKWTSGFPTTAHRGEHTATIQIVDNQNCGVKLPGIEVEVEVKNTLVTLSGDHLHFKDSTEKGTGEYIRSNPDWQAISNDNTTINVNSDTNGAIQATYKSGKFGLEETLSATAKDPNSSRTFTATKDFAIKVPGLVKIPEDGTYDFTGYDSPPPRVCDNNHNPSTAVRSGVYVTPFTEVMLGYLNFKWLALGSTSKLCLNDGSLKYGGFFDEGLLNDRATNCHDSHRLGIDVDITTAAAACTENIETGMLTINGKQVKKSKVFWLLAEELEAYKPHSNHLRFGR